MSIKRIEKEKSSFLEKQIEGVKIEYDQKNPLEIYFTIEGPKGTPYFGAQFNFKFVFPNDYPFKPMNIVSFQRIYFYPDYNCVINRCNCCTPGDFRLGKDAWSPQITFLDQIKSLQKCFYAEHFLNIYDINSDSSRLYKSNRDQYNFEVKSVIAREYANKYVKQFIVFEREIKQFLSMNSNEIFIDLFF